MKVRSYASVSAVTLGILAFACGGGDDGGGNGTEPPTTGTVSGQVLEGGSGVSDVQVALSTVGNTTTNASGSYAFTEVDPGTYTISITLPDGKALEEDETLEKSVTVTAGQTQQVSWDLKAETPGNVQEIRVSGTSFSPNAVTITAGMTVRWIVAEAGHTLTPREPGQTGVWEEQDPLNVGNFEHTFTTAGQTYNYFCEPHESFGMTGSITVN